MTMTPKDALKRALLAPGIAVTWGFDDDVRKCNLDEAEVAAIVDAIEGLIRQTCGARGVADSAAGEVYVGARDVLAEALTGVFFEPMAVAEKFLKKLEAAGYALVRAPRP